MNAFLANFRNDWQGVVTLMLAISEVAIVAAACRRSPMADSDLRQRFTTG
jgi:hypothetical protein